LALERLLAPTQVADGIDLEFPEVGTEALPRHLHGNALARSRGKQSFPTLVRLRAVEQGRNRTIDQLSQPPLRQLQKKLIGIDDATRPCEQQGLVVPGDVEGLPNQPQDRLIMTLLPVAAGDAGRGWGDRALIRCQRFNTACRLRL